MALLYMQGFESEHNMSVDGWYIANSVGYAASDSIVKHSGNYSYHLQNNTNSTSFQVYMNRIFPNDTSVLILGFAFYQTDLGKATNQNYQLYIRDNANSRALMFRHVTGNKIEVQDVGSLGTNTVIARTPNPVGPNAQHYIQIKYVQHPINGEFKMLIGNELVCDVTHRNFASNDNKPKFIQFGVEAGGGNLNMYLDDIYVLNGDPPLNDFLGICNILGQVPNDEGSQNDFEVYNATDLTSALKELSADTNTYVWSASLNAKALFKSPPINTPGQILAVAITDYAARSAAGSGYGKYKYLLKDSTGNEYLGDEIVLNSSTFSTHEQIFYTNPFTNDSWDLTSVNELEYGVQITQVV